ncbi:hypothetical protein MFLAVUS_002925 [Mucor flavus]|uniref:Uncharacterized protein n=1 Tax=Mucor flavus TaxID=439312 RepID=A0ABP9YRM2_9FUNG
MDFADEGPNPFAVRQLVNFDPYLKKKASEPTIQNETERSKDIVKDDAVEMLTSKFAGLEIKKSRVHEFMRDECNLSLKQTTRWPEARANEHNVQNRYD